MKTVGKYEVFEQLGTGSMGVIYRAHDTILDRDVALKTIAGTGPVDAELKERFYREAKACARLQHPNVVMIYELGEEDNLLFIALELLTGCDLRRFITERRPLPDAKKLEVIAGVCDGLQKAHDAGIIHRDLKPSNIFLTNDGVGKLLDFGVARLPSSKLTVVGRVIGTPNYMAPEQILGKPCDARTDIFALGIVAYEFLTFAHPFAGASVPKRIMNDAPDSLTARNPALPADLAPVIGKALAKDPDERYKSADEFGRALRTVLATCFGAESLSKVSTESLSIPSPSSVVSTPAPPPVSPELPKDMNTEYKMSEILGALQKFDAALDRENVADARAALQTVDQLAKIDDRFAAAATESHGRLSELEARVPAPPPVAVAPPPVAAAAPPPITAPPTRPADLPVASSTGSRPITQSRPTPPVLTAPAPPAKSAFLDPPPIADVPPPAGNVFTSSEPGDVTSLFIPQPSSLIPKPSSRPTERPFDPAPPANFSTAESISNAGSRVGSASETRQAAESPQRRVPSAEKFTPPPLFRAKAPVQTDPGLAPAPSLDPPHQKWWAKISRWDFVITVISTAAVGLMMVFVHFLFLNQSDVARVPSLASALVATDQASIFASPSDRGDIVMNLKKGDKVNVIHPPRSRSQEWTEVQYVLGNRVYRTGVIKTSELTGWSSFRADIAFDLLKEYAPVEGANETQLREYTRELSSFIQQFPEATQASEARAELDRSMAALGQVGTAVDKQREAGKTNR